MEIPEFARNPRGDKNAMARILGRAGDISGRAVSDLYERSKIPLRVVHNALSPSNISAQANRFANSFEDSSAPVGVGIPVRSMSAEEFPGLGHWTPNSSAPKEQQAQPPQMTEAEALKQRFGYSTSASKEDSDPNSPRNIAARSALLSRPTDAGIQDYVPEGNDTSGDYLGIMARDGQNDAIRMANQANVARADQAEAARQQQLQNALRQEAANQKMAVEADEATRLQEFFQRTGVVPSPQAVVEFQRQMGRQRAFSEFVAELKNLAAMKREALAGALRGFENEPNLPPSVQQRLDQIEQEFSSLEAAIAAGSGMMGGVQNPGNMIPREDSGLR